MFNIRQKGTHKESWAPFLPLVLMVGVRLTQCKGHPGGCHTKNTCSCRMKTNKTMELGPKEKWYSPFCPENHCFTGIQSPVILCFNRILNIWSFYFSVWKHDLHGPVPCVGSLPIKTWFLLWLGKTVPKKVGKGTAQMVLYVHRSAESRSGVGTHG